MENNVEEANHMEWNNGRTLKDQEFKIPLT